MQRRNLTDHKAELIDLLTQLSAACDLHKDELIARVDYYLAIADNYDTTHSKSLELEPVPSAMVPILIKLKEIHQVIKEGDASEYADVMTKLLSQEQLTVDRITPNIHFLFDYLNQYSWRSQDNRYLFFSYLGHGVAAVWLTFDNKRDAEQLPALQSNNKISLTEKVKEIASQINALQSTDDKRMKAILETPHLPDEAKLNEISKLKFADLLMQLSDACDLHRDELVARAHYYKTIQEEVAKSGRNYFKDHARVLEPVPNPLVPILMNLREFPQPSSSDGADDLQEYIYNLLPNDQEFFDKIIQNIYYLDDILNNYSTLTLDNRYNFAFYVGNCITAKWKSFSNKRDISQIPDVQAENEVSLDDKVNLITLQMEELTARSPEDEQIKITLNTRELPFEAKLNYTQMYINEQFVEMKKDLNTYYQALLNEIREDVVNNVDFYKQFFENDPHFLDDYTTEGILNTLCKNIEILREKEESVILPREKDQSSRLINDALMKYEKIHAIYQVMNDKKSSQPKVIKKSIQAINDALPVLEKSRDTTGIRILKALLSIFILPIFFIYKTKGATLAKKHLSSLSLFQINEQRPVKNDHDRHHGKGNKKKK